MGHYPGIEKDTALVRKLVSEHLGPLPELNTDLKRRIEQIVKEVPDEDGTWPDGTHRIGFCAKTCHQAIVRAGISISPRQSRLFYNDEFDRRAAEYITEIKRRRGQT